MKTIAIILAVMVATLGAISLGGTPQQLFPAAVTGVIAIAFWWTD